MIKLKLLLEKKDPYDRVRDAWKKAHKRVPIHSVGSHEYPKKIYQATIDEMNKEFKKEFPKGAFTDKQIYRSLFSDRIKTGMDAWDYLSDLIEKRMSKK